jgi:hypothetical protein
MVSRIGWVVKLAKEDSMPAEKPGFNPVILALFSISIMCGIYIGLNERSIPPYAAALGFLLWGALPHGICLFESIRHGHTEASVVLMLFMGFWLYLGIGLLTLPVHDLHLCLRYAEPVIGIATFVMVYFYRDKTSLARILVGLGLTVGWLWLSKLIGAPSWIGSWVVGVLGVFVFIVAVIQLKQHQTRVYQYRRQNEFDRW